MEHLFMLDSNQLAYTRRNLVQVKNPTPDDDALPFVIAKVESLAPGASAIKGKNEDKGEEKEETGEYSGPLEDSSVISDPESYGIDVGIEPPPPPDLSPNPRPAAKMSEESEEEEEIRRLECEPVIVVHLDEGYLEYTEFAKFREEMKNQTSANTTPQDPPFVWPKPPLSMTMMLALAIMNAEEITMADICIFISKHFPFFDMKDSGWKREARYGLKTRYFAKVTDSQSARRGWIINPAMRKQLEDELALVAVKNRRALTQAMSDPENLELILKGQFPHNGRRY